MKTADFYTSKSAISVVSFFNIDYKISFFQKARKKLCIQEK
jgi:hypothetical protein